MSSITLFATRVTGRPMKIEIVVDPSRPAPLAQRVAPAPAPAAVAANSTKTPRLVLCV